VLLLLLLVPNRLPNDLLSRSLSDGWIALTVVVVVILMATESGGRAEAGNPDWDVFGGGRGEGNKLRLENGGGK
jgi:hypothetical protein